MSRVLQRGSLPLFAPDLSFLMDLFVHVIVHAIGFF